MFEHTLMTESYLLFSFYLVLGPLCWFFFFHHPSHTNIQITKDANANAYTFNTDNTSNSWRQGRETDQLKRDDDQQNLRVGINEIGADNKLDVTLVDALRIRELTFLIVSYLFRQTHNTFIKQSNYYVAESNVEGILYFCGAIVGVLVTGLVSDRWLLRKRFLMIFIINAMLLGFDIFIFATASSSPPSEGQGFWTDFFSIFLGAILESADLIYLILMPMLIAKNHSEQMSRLSQYQRVCFAGTIVGVTLALCMVGKYLFSDNLATFFDYLVNLNCNGSNCNTQIFFSDLIVIVLLIFTNLALWPAVRRELYSTSFYRKLCCLKDDSAWRTKYEDQDNPLEDSGRENYMPSQLSPRWTHQQ